MLTWDDNRKLYVPSQKSQYLSGFVALPCFWLLILLSCFYWYGPRISFLNGRVERGWLIRYKPLRLEAFSDGVVAIAVTILAIEFPAPLDINAVEYLHRMKDVALYGVIFSILFVHWYLHYRMVHWIRATNLPLYWLNVVFCFFLTMSPLSVKLAQSAADFGSAYHGLAHTYCFLIFCGIGVSQIIECIYILRTETLHKAGHAIPVRLKFLILFGCAATPFAAIVVRLIALSDWGGAVFLYYLSPAINICLYLALGGTDPKDSEHNPTAYRKMGEASDKSVPMSERSSAAH